MNKESPEMTPDPNVDRLRDIVTDKIQHRDQALPDIAYPKNKKFLGKTFEISEEDNLVKKESQERLLDKAAEKTAAACSMAEQIYKENFAGLRPDNELLDNIADLATDFFTKDWHEQVDDHLQKEKIDRWEASKESRLKEIHSNYEERNKGE
ncbi:MAG: hypothetical protein V1838_04400 [Patescibacteria group bacterium]